MSASFDVIILGVGSMGSAALYQLARRGFRVLGLDRFPVPHDRGSHGGQSRIIRKAYFEHSDYVPLLERSYHGWSELESETGAQLYTETGLLYAGSSKSTLVQGVLTSAEQFQIPVQKMSAAEARQIYPAFHIPEGYEVVVEPAAGLLKPEAAINTLLNRAVELGATIRTGLQAEGWSLIPDGVEVSTSEGKFRAARLIVTAGSWVGHLVPLLKSSLTVTRQVVCWFRTRQPKVFAPGKFPCWLFDEAETGNVFYGFPQLDSNLFQGPEGLKFAQHNPGRTTDPEIADVGDISQELEVLHRSAQKLFPDQIQGISEVKTCLYTYSPDEHFIIDLLPEHDQRVVVAAGFSGHGFKFVPVIGEILADLAIDGRTVHPAGFLGLRNRKF